MAMGISILEATTAEHLAAARALFIEYARQLGHDLGFQHFDEELESLPAGYAAPTGCLLLAQDGAAWPGCVAVRRLGSSRERCEMKRLYVRPSHRRTGLGRRLAEAVIERARQLGYTVMVLDTLRGMTPARTLYESLGFRETAAYYDNPLEGVVYYELRLA
jgi:GNAT superfamily N-acetyltransferase